MEYCSQHAPDGMVNIDSRKCKTEGCGKQSSYGVAGTKTAEFCAQHAVDYTQHSPDGMVDVYNRKCRTKGWGKGPSYGIAGTKTMEYCAQHALDRMVDVCDKKCRTEGCGKVPSYGVAGTKLWSTVHRTHWTGWSTSITGSAEPKAAASSRRLE